MSVNSTNPSILFGGEWTRITGRFLLGADDSTYKNGNTGGEATHKLTVSEMPSHNHGGNTGVGISNGLMRMVGASGTTDYGGNHVPGPASSAYMDFQSSSRYPGANHYHSFTTDSKGGDTAHNNMPPYLVVYMWKRTS